MASRGGNGTPTVFPRGHHSSSRSNSFSSASIITMKRTGSLSSTSTGTRSSAVPMRSSSPGEPSLIALRVGRDREPIPQEHKRHKSVATDAAEHGCGDGANNMNRWSHSTASSITSLGNTRRSRANSGAALASMAPRQFSPAKRSRVGVDLEQSPRASPQRVPASSRLAASDHPHSPDRNTNGASRADLNTSLTDPPPFHATPALAKPNDTKSPSTLPITAAPTTHFSSTHEHLDESGSASRSTGMNNNVIHNHTTAGAHPQVAGSDSVQEPLRKTRTADNPGHDRANSSAARESGHRNPRTREGRDRDRKSMLAKALQKANTAVLLDNAQNFEGALDAYSDACRLLQQVMERSLAADDKQMLEAIKVTYTNRIEELRRLEMARPPTSEGKTLPSRPMSDDSIDLGHSIEASSPPLGAGADDSAFVGTAATATMTQIPRLSYHKKDRDSFFWKTMEAVEQTSRNGTENQDDLPRRPILPMTPETEEIHRPEESQILPRALHAAGSDVSSYMPAPLFPRRPSSPKLKPEAEHTWQHDLGSGEPLANQQQTEPPLQTFRDRANSTHSTSWLDTIDESGSSRASSVHSVSSKTGIRKRKHIRGMSGTSDPDFDVAFDAAVEAVYNEGFEPDFDSQTRRAVVYKHAIKDSIVIPSSEIKELLSPTSEFQPTTSLGRALGEDDEEERLLDEITSDFSQGFDFDLSNKSALPRQSDSSGYSRSTWQSSQTSTDRATAATSLSTVAEDTLSTRAPQPPSNAPTPNLPPPPVPPPTASLPSLPPLPVPQSAGPQPLSTVRSRRLSGQSNHKQLKIETSNIKPEARKRASTFHHSPGLPYEMNETKALESEFKFDVTLQPSDLDTQHEHMLKSPPSLDLRSATSATSMPLTLTIDDGRPLDDELGDQPLSARPILFRKNKSSVSLRAEHTLLLSSPDDFGPSIATPMSSTFMSFASKRSQDPLNLQRARIPVSDAGFAGGVASRGAVLFDTSLSATPGPTSPRSPHMNTQPVTLEPCPESFLLRPFWLVRALATTLAHPRGGFVTMRLFVPREVWHTRGVKLKSVEDKIANCDLLTAALGRLAGVDTYDADAVMDELQSFEEIMERVQTALGKKLGHDVGVHGVAALFKDAPGAPAAGSGPGPTAAGAADATPGAEKTKSKESKGYLTSWRKLRSKSSGLPVAAAATTPSAAHHKPADRDVPPMPSVPMTHFVPVERRGPKSDVRALTFDGPNKEYMGSLARLFEGAQVLDQIARQVEDPGLKHSSPTHVGLELSIRHAAEFFAFFICRFVLADLGLLIDKFVKRGSEWVMA